MADSTDDVFRDLEDEYDRIESILSSLTAEQWQASSGAPGWSVADTVVHLVHTEEQVATTLQVPASTWTVRDGTLDAVVDDQVRATNLADADLLERWNAARRASVRALATADPTETFRWAAAPLKPKTLATTRLAEHWAHTLDITEPLGIDYPDTDRIRHIAWLGHATLPYAMGLAGLPVEAVLCTLTNPSGTTVTFGPTDAPLAITGSMGAFCRVGARRLSGDASGLRTNGPRAEAALRVLRNYAA